MASVMGSCPTTTASGLSGAALLEIVDSACFLVDTGEERLSG
jgi:hypothetical protein